MHVGRGAEADDTPPPFPQQPARFIHCLAPSLAPPPFLRNGDPKLALLASVSSVESNGPDRAGPSKCLGACPFFTDRAEPFFREPGTKQPGVTRKVTAAARLTPRNA